MGETQVPIGPKPRKNGIASLKIEAISPGGIRGTGASLVSVEDLLRLEMQQPKRRRQVELSEQAKARANLGTPGPRQRSRPARRDYPSSVVGVKSTTSVQVDVPEKRRSKNDL